MHVVPEGQFIPVMPARRGPCIYYIIKQGNLLQIFWVFAISKILLKKRTKVEEMWIYFLFAITRNCYANKAAPIKIRIIQLT